MKCRGLVVLDYQIEGGFLEAAEEQKKLEDAIASIVKRQQKSCVSPGRYEGASR